MTNRTFGVAWVLGVTLLAAAAWAQADPQQPGQQPMGDADLKAAEQAIQAGDWDKASQAADRVYKAVTAETRDTGKASPECTTAASDLRSAVSSRSRDKAMDAISRLRTHCPQFKGAGGGAPPRAPSDR
ncbi:MAG TPA: hypothetical protein VNO22_10405 [Planctomycetota bacterium]|nr:hypothetical protein [Planctomycetota bacterium]